MTEKEAELEFLMGLSDACRVFLFSFLVSVFKEASRIETLKKFILKDNQKLKKFKNSALAHVQKFKYLRY